MTFAEEAAEIARRLEAAARADGLPLTGDLRTTTDGAARLLGVESRTMERWRAAGEGPRLFRLGGRCSYSLRDLAEFTLRSRCTAAEFAREQARPTFGDNGRR